jgi:uncharacterized protein (DUF2342 family)
MHEANPEDQASALKQALFAGRKIEAIKLYREQTNVGLAEAKAAVEALEAELRQSMPGSFSKPSSKGGCGTTAVLVLALGFAAMIRIARELIGLAL